mmetsp:Transcript_34892/g.48566  ORF Transcript_34892/g.48566 Transcript_34892/m.48566 type:complete len:125 (-) Transcript_34892:419-793(-)
MLYLFVSAMLCVSCMYFSVGSNKQTSNHKLHTSLYHALFCSTEDYPHSPYVKHITNASSCSPELRILARAALMYDDPFARGTRQSAREETIIRRVGTEIGIPNLLAAHGTLRLGVNCEAFSFYL